MGDIIQAAPLLAIACAATYYAGFSAGEYRGFRKGADIWKVMCDQWRWQAYRMERLQILTMLNHLDLDEDRRNDLLIRLDVLNAKEGEFHAPESEAGHDR